MKDSILSQPGPEADPFGLRGFDFSVRVPERSEMFTEKEAHDYIDGCDYPQSVDDLLLALEMESRFGLTKLSRMKILDAMAGPGRLGRELIALGAGFVVGHDGDETMIAHEREKALALNGRMHVVKSPVDNIPLPEMFDLVVCHNATHQLSTQEKLRATMQEFLRLIVPGGHIVIADYQRDTSPKFIAALEERLRWTKPEIVPLLIPTFQAAFTKEEFGDVLSSVPGIETRSVTDAKPPLWLSREMRARVEQDPVKGHLLDFSPISLRAVAKKKEKL